MTKKAQLSWADKLKTWRKEKEEEYAKAILSPPEVANLYSMLPYPGVALIMGGRREGKTGFAHQVAHQFQSRRKLPAVLHLPTAPIPIRKHIQKLLPPWMKVVSRMGEWPKNCIVIYDEAAQSAHARRSQSGNALALDNLIGISGQRNQTILFISHHSRKIDVNIIHEVNRIIWKKPTYAHQMWERDELSDFTMRAYDYFQGIKGSLAQKKATLILNMDNLKFYSCNNSLPPWWSDDLSKLFQDIQL